MVTQEKAAQTRIYLIRHAETMGNIEQRACGWYEVEPSENGLHQIEELGKRFSNVHLDAVYSSDIGRAKATAKALYLPKSLPLNTDIGLRELYFGDWEGKKWEEINSETPDELRRFKTRAPGWRAPNGETVEEVAERMYAAISAIAQSSIGKTIAIVSHGASVGAFLAKVLGISPGDIPLSDNTSVSCLVWEGQEFKPLYICDSSHLPPQLSSIAKQTEWHRKFGAKTSLPPHLAALVGRPDGTENLG